MVEVAPSHRHTQSALRLVMEGDGAYTAVAGERAPMRTGDLLLTPSWTWHDHGNDGDSPAIWLDGLDVQLVRFLGASFTEPYLEASQPLTRPEGDSRARYGRNMLPFGEAIGNPASPILHYPHDDYREALERMRARDDWDICHGLKLAFINPRDGGPVMPTLDVFVQLLPAGFATEPYRSTDAVVLSVVEGEGEAVIGDQAFSLKPRDTLVVPGWTPWRLAAAGDLVVVGFSDGGVQRKLGLWREQRGDAPG